MRAASVALAALLALVRVMPVSAASPVTPAQLTVATANATGDAVYTLALTPNAAGTSALISAATQTLNSDGAKHGSFDALVWVPNAFTGTLDLIVADATKGQILRYAGPTYGTATPLFTYTTKGSGPAAPAGLSVDAAGDLFVISPGTALLATPGVWVLPFNKAIGTYGSPVLIDQSFGGTRTLALAEVLVAGTAATPDGGAAPAWHAGDLLVLVGDTFDSRLIVYSQGAVAAVLANPKTPLTGPTATVISSKQFLSEVAVPFGVDIWPADATHGVSLLVTTIDGRILRFDSRQNAFAANFASGLGLGLQKLKVGVFAGTPYAFVTQRTPLPSGQILQFGAPPASGANKPLAVVTKGVSAPIGLALVSSGSVPASSCVAPGSCSPLGPELTLQISGPGVARIPAGATVLQQGCSVPADPRVAVVGGVWSCLGPTINVCGTTPTPGCVPTTLDVANYCPGFPSTILPPFMCGHSGASGAGFAVVKATANLLDENANDLYLQSSVDPAAVLPGPYDIGCATTAGQYGSLFAFAPRSDLPTIEGSIVEDKLAPYFIELTGSCDDPDGNTHVESMFAFGLGLNASASGLGTGPSGGLFGFVTNKFSNLQTTIANYSPQITPATVTTTLENYVTQSQTYFNNDYQNDVGMYSCALNSIASADVYLRNQAMTSAFSYTPPAAGNNNPNPAGAIDSRLANLYLTISGDFLAMPNLTWPVINVPPCVTLKASVPTVGAGGSATLTYGPPQPQFATTSLDFAPASCTLSATDGSFVAPMHVAIPTAAGATNSVSTGPLTKTGVYTATLDCAGPPGDTSTGATTASIVVTAAPTLKSVAVTPAAASIAAGLTQTFTAAGTSTANTPFPLSSLTWAAANSGASAGQASAVASITSAGVAQCLRQGTATVTATSAGVTGTAPLTCLAAQLEAIAVPAAPQSIPAGLSYQYQAGGTSTLNTPFTLTSVTWTAVNSGASVGQPPVASISSTGLAQCLTQGTASITAASGGVSGSTTLICGAPPSATLTAGSPSVRFGVAVLLTWSSSGLPAGTVCTLTSNSTDAPLHLANLATSGSFSTTDNVPQTVTYTFSCPGLPAAATTSVAYTVRTTYQYTGNTFPSGDAYQQYSTSDRVIASLTLDAPIPANQTYVDLTTLPGFQLTMSDGVQTLQSGAANLTAGAYVTTDPNGNITQWSVGLNGPSQTKGIDTQSLPPDGTVDYGYIGPGTLCESPTDCGSIANSAGVWTSTNELSLHVLYATTGQIYSALVGGTPGAPTLSKGALVSETPEPGTCTGPGGTAASNPSPDLTGIAFLPNAATGFRDLVATNPQYSDVFRLSGPSLQPASDINNASSSCWNTGPSVASVAGDASGDMLGVGVDVSTYATPAIYFFPPVTAGAPPSVPNYVLIQNVNADPSLTGTCDSPSGMLNEDSGCTAQLADAVVAPTAFTAAGIGAGDLLVLVGDNYTGSSNVVVMRVPAAAIATAKNYASTCPASYGYIPNTAGGLPPACLGATVGGSQLVTQTNFTTVMQYLESPLSMDISPVDGSLLILTSLGNIYRVPLTGSGYGTAQLYATTQTAGQSIRAAQQSGTLYLFEGFNSDAYNGVNLFVGNTLGVLSATLNLGATGPVVTGLAVH